MIPASFFPTAAVFAVMILETGVACVQSYVFLMLICMYLHGALFLH
jgi:F0F1-type ATP synthase membrane subunit a